MGINVPSSWKFLFSGKVRDIYEVNTTTLAFVATDRLSAFDWVFPNPIPDKGKILSQFSKFWFAKTENICSNHFLKDEKGLPQHLGPRTMLVRKAQVYPFEFVIRGYLAGSLWKSYQTYNLQPTTYNLPKGLSFGDSIPGGPILTPTTKEKTPCKHDEDIPWGVVADSLGKEKAASVKKKALEIFAFAHDYLMKRGIVLVDTKFEFGEKDGQVILVDEILTPDSSRFWWAKDYKKRSEFRGQRSEVMNLEPLDKQVIRDYLEKELRWDKKPPIPQLPPEIISKTRTVYLEVFRAITGKDPIL